MNLVWKFARSSRMGQALLNSRIGLVLRGMMLFRQAPEEKDKLGGVLNGQELRRKIVDGIFSEWKPDVVVETGTYKGITTEYFSQFKVPVYTVEFNPLYYGIAKARLSRRRNVHLELGDSREFLKHFTRRKTAINQRVFYYLDAHWTSNLPLYSELESIFEATSNCLVMIDDFRVSDDADYHYDDYGPGKALVWDYVHPLIEKHSLTALSPNFSGRDETGLKRGCLVLTSQPNTSLKLVATGLLRPVIEQCAIRQK